MSVAVVSSISVAYNEKRRPCFVATYSLSEPRTLSSSPSSLIAESSRHFLWIEGRDCLFVLEVEFAVSMISGSIL